MQLCEGISTQSARSNVRGSLLYVRATSNSVNSKPPHGGIYLDAQAMRLRNGRTR